MKILISLLLFKCAFLEAQVIQEWVAIYGGVGVGFFVPAESPAYEYFKLEIKTLCGDSADSPYVIDN
jgi:hypothetical protein